MKFETGRQEVRASLTPETTGYRASTQANSQGSSGAAERVVPFIVSGNTSPSAPQAPTTQTVVTTTPSNAPIATETVARSAITQISAALNTPSNARRIDLTLDPPELGRIEIMMEVAETGMKAMLTAERHATGDMIRRQSDLLTQQLNDAGFESVDISFSDFADGETYEAGADTSDTTGFDSQTGSDQSPSQERRRTVRTTAMDMRL